MTKWIIPTIITILTALLIIILSFWLKSNQEYELLQRDNALLNNKISQLENENKLIKASLTKKAVSCRYGTEVEQEIELVPTGELILNDNIPLFTVNGAAYSDEKYSTYLAGFVRYGKLGAVDVSGDPYYIGIYSEYDEIDGVIVDAVPTHSDEGKFLIRFVKHNDKYLIFTDGNGAVEILTDNSIKLEKDTDEFISDPVMRKMLVALNNNVEDYSTKDFSILDCIIGDSVDSAMFGPAGSENYLLTADSKQKYSAWYGYKPIESFEEGKVVDTYKGKNIYEVDGKLYLASTEGMALPLTKIK